MRTLAVLLAFLLPVSLAAVSAAQVPCTDCGRTNAPPPKPLPLPPPLVVLEVLAPCAAGADGEIPYEIMVENRGRTAAHSVQVKNSVPANAEFRRGEPAPAVTGKELVWDLGSLAPGECRRLRMVLKGLGGDVDNCVRVSFEHGVCTRTKVAGTPPTSPPATDEPITPPSQLTPPQLEFVGDFPERVAVNSSFTAKVEVANAGRGVAHGTLLILTLPPGVICEQSQPPGAFFAESNELRWQIGKLEAGARQPIALTLKGQEIGRKRLTVALQADSVARQERDYSIEFFGGVGLHMEVRDRQDPLLVGEETEYEILVRNTGNIPATRIGIAAAAPIELQMSRPRGPIDDVNFQTGDPTVRFNPFNLQPGQEVVFRINAKAVRPGFTKFQVQMTADQLPSGPVLREEPTNIVSDIGTSDFITLLETLLREGQEWLRRGAMTAGP